MKSRTLVTSSARTGQIVGLPGASAARTRLGSRARRLRAYCFITSAGMLAKPTSADIALLIINASGRRRLTADVIDDRVVTSAPSPGHEHQLATRSSAELGRHRSFDCCYRAHLGCRFGMSAISADQRPARGMMRCSAVAMFLRVLLLFMRYARFIMTTSGIMFVIGDQAHRGGQTDRCGASLCGCQYRTMIPLGGPRRRAGQLPRSSCFVIDNDRSGVVVALCHRNCQLGYHRPLSATQLRQRPKS